MNTNTEMKRTPAIAATITGDLMVLVFGNDKTLSIRAADLDGNLQLQALMHGLKQKLIDAAAISRNTDTGKAASIDDKYEAVKAVLDRLLAGEWNATREGAGTGGLLFRALVRAYPAKTEEQLREWLGKKSDAEKTAMRKNPKVAAIIETIRAETGKAANVDTEALLDELDGE